LSDECVLSSVWLVDVEETVEEEYERLGTTDNRGKALFGSRSASRCLTPDFTEDSVTFDVVLAIEHVDERETDLISASRPFMRTSGPAAISVAPEREDKTERVESPLMVRSIGGRVRGRDSVVGVGFVLGRRGVCSAREGAGGD
jgi:hypothetical protein